MDWNGNHNNGNNRNNYNSTSARRNGRRDRVENQTVNIRADASEANRSMDDMFKSFTRLSRDIEKSYSKTVKNIAAMTLTTSKRTYDQLDKMHESYTKNYIAREAVAQNKIAVNTINSQNKVFVELERMHSDYLNTYIKNEAIAADKVAKIWGRASVNTDIGTVNFDSSSNSTDTNSRIVSVFDELEAASRDMLENMEDLSSGIEDTMREIDRSNKNKIANRNAHEVRRISDDIEDMSDRARRDHEETIRSNTMVTDILEWGFGRLIDITSEYVRTYQNIYNTIATRSGYTRSRTSRYVSETVKDLRNSGYLGSVNVNDDLLQSIAKVSEEGLKGEVARSKAFGDAVAKVLMPWLDTNTEAFINLSANLSESSINQLKGQQLLLRETQSGNRLLQTGVINSLTSDLGPSLQNIDYNTGGAANLSAEYQSLMASLVSSGFSNQEAYEVAKKMISVYNNGYEAITSGDTMTRLLAREMFVNGNDVIGSYANVNSMYRNIAGNASGPFGVSAVTNSLGGQLFIGDAAQTLDAILSGRGVIDISETREYAEQLVKYAEQTYDSLEHTSNQYVTTTDIITNTIENLSTVLGDPIKDLPLQIGNVLGYVLGAIGIRQFFRGDGSIARRIARIFGRESATELAEEAARNGGSGLLSGLSVAGVGGTVGVLGGAYVTASTISRMSEKSWGATSAEERIADAFSLAAGAGAVGTGVAAVALGSNPLGWIALGLAGVGVAANELAKQLDETSATVKEFHEESKQERKERKAEYAALGYKDSLNKFREEFSYLGDDVLDSLLDGKTDSSIDKMADEFFNEQRKYTETVLQANEENYEEQFGSILDAMVEEGRIDEVEEILKELGGKRVSQKAMNNLRSGKWKASGILSGEGGGIGLFNTQKDIAKDLSADQWSAIIAEYGLKNYDTDAEVQEHMRAYASGSHANGLSEVPFDGYLAELHRGETVLTATEARNYKSNSLALIRSVAEGNKGLSEAYRSASNNSNNSDAIVKALKEISSDIIKTIREVSSKSDDKFSRLIKPTNNYNDSIINLNTPIVAE